MSVVSVPLQGGVILEDIKHFLQKTLLLRRLKVYILCTAKGSDQERI